MLNKIIAIALTAGFATVSFAQTPAPAAAAEKKTETPKAAETVKTEAAKPAEAPKAEHKAHAKKAVKHEAKGDVKTIPATPAPASAK